MDYGLQSFVRPRLRKCLSCGLDLLGSVQVGVTKFDEAPARRRAERPRRCLRYDALPQFPSPVDVAGEVMAHCGLATVLPEVFAPVSWCMAGRLLPELRGRRRSSPGPSAAGGLLQRARNLAVLTGSAVGKMPGALFNVGDQTSEPPMQTSPLTCRRRGVVDCAEKRMRETDALGIHLDYPRGRSSVEVLVDELRAVSSRGHQWNRWL